MAFENTKKLIQVQRAILKNCLDGLAGLPIEWKRNANEINVLHEEIKSCIIDPVAKEIYYQSNQELNSKELPKKDIKIIDNYLDKNVFKKLQDALLSDMFPWFFNNSKLDYTKLGERFYDINKPIQGGGDVYHQHQFTHNFFGSNALSRNWSNFTHHIEPLLNKINPRVWIRIKANMSTINSKPIIGGWHYDMVTKDIAWSDTMTALFYINTNNGYTQFEDGNKITSVENRLVIAPNNLMHTSVSQTDTKHRVVLNINYLDH
tara:strand:+ start:2791 stop:3576 length:786 start_codon:yes stop_codon:yes gene_type:complete